MIDTFISYSRADQDQVRVLAEILHRLGIAVWFDEWSLSPGSTWQKAISDTLCSCKSAIVTIGPSGIGPWESMEAMLAIDRATKDGAFRLIPLLLPGAPEQHEIEIPPFLRMLTWADFRAGFEDGTKIRQLIAGIRGSCAASSVLPNGQQNGLMLPHGNSDVEAYAKAFALTDCLRILGVPASKVNELSDRFLRECKGLIEDSNHHHTTDHYEAIEGLALPQAAKNTILCFLDEWLDFLVPRNVVMRSFYISKSKIAKARRLISFEKNKVDSDDETLFIKLHKYYFEKGLLRSLTVERVLERNLRPESMPTCYFSGAFSFCFQSQLIEEFPFARSILEDSRKQPGLSIVNRIIDDPDPFKMTYLKLDGFLLDYPVSMTISRKYIRIQSDTVGSLLALFGGQMHYMSGFGSLEREATGEYVIQPVVLRFSAQQRRGC